MNYPWFYNYEPCVDEFIVLTDIVVYYELIAQDGTYSTYYYYY